MEELYKNKLSYFANDPQMMDAVRGVLLENFLEKKSGEDLNMKAGRFIATELLAEAWKELEGYKMSGNAEDKVGGNIGL